MEINETEVLICNCGETMPLDPKKIGDGCNLESKPKIFNSLCTNEINEFILNSIKVIVLSSVIWGFESNRKYQLHHLEVNHRILSNFSDCLKRHNTRERCEHEKQFLRYIFKQDY